MKLAKEIASERAEIKARKEGATGELEIKVEVEADFYSHTGQETQIHVATDVVARVERGK